MLDNFSGNNTISGNNATHNYHGIHLYESSSNSIYQNRMDNPVDAYDNGINQWDNGFALN